MTVGVDRTEGQREETSIASKDKEECEMIVGRWRRKGTSLNATSRECTSINGLFNYNSPITGSMNVLGDKFRGLDSKYVDAVNKAQEIKELIKTGNTPEAIAKRRAHNNSMVIAGWTPISSAVDSAASGSVIPPDTVSYTHLTLPTKA